MARSKWDTATKTLSGAVGAGGTFTVNYPSGKAANDYRGGDDHIITSASFPTLFAKSNDFSLTFGGSNITVTLNTGMAMASGTALVLNLDRSALDGDEEPEVAQQDNVTNLSVVRISLGTPATADADGYFASQNLTSAGVASVNTTVAAAIAAAALAGTADVPRNVVAAWTGTAVLTVTGTDVFGNVLVESSASGTSFTGAKAFKTVTNISVSANVTSLTVGTGVVLGLPVFLPGSTEVIREIMDNATATAGTLAAGVTSTATATTGDVRGTYNPNSAPNGSRQYELIAALRNPAYRGGAQYAG